MNDTLIYLACPYTHPDPAVREKRFRIANRVAGRLLSEGRFCFSPISMSVPIAEDAGLSGAWDFWAKFDRALLERCQKVVVIDIEGTANSVGVNAELAIAAELRLPIEYVKGVV